MSHTAEANTARCVHCGREVKPTRHTRTGYRVDYYSMHTGESEPGTLLNEDGSVEMVYQKLLHAREIITCVDCYARAEAQAERERLFRPERVNGATLQAD